MYTISEDTSLRLLRQILGKAASLRTQQMDFSAKFPSCLNKFFSALEMLDFSLSPFLLGRWTDRETKRQIHAYVDLNISLMQYSFQLGTITYS